MSKKDMMGVKINIATGKMLTGMAEGLTVTLSKKLTKDTPDFIQKAAATAQQVLIHTAECLTEMAEDVRLCIRFAEELNILPNRQDSVEVTAENAEEVLAEMEKDDDVPDDIKDFLRSMVRVTKFMNKKCEKKDD